MWVPGIGRLRPDTYFGINPRRKETRETFLEVAGLRTRDFSLEIAPSRLCTSASEAQTALTTRSSRRLNLDFDAPELDCGSVFRIRISDFLKIFEHLKMKSSLRLIILGFTAPFHGLLPRSSDFDNFPRITGAFSSVATRPRQRCAAYIGSFAPIRISCVKIV